MTTTMQRWGLASIALLAGLSVTLRAPAAPVPVPRWTFADGTANDAYGLMDGTLQGEATISGGRLQLNGTDAHVCMLLLPVNVSEKTLVAKVSLATLDQGGGAITLQTSDLVL